MKPINIEISAFGPYKDKVDVDFTRIGENGIFLITGDTGAGKTTIFDAIVFALYGNVSGSNRQISSIRSDFAEPETKTYVSLNFIHKGKDYLITRNPQYERPKKSGEGTTLQMPDASIESNGEVIASGITNVDNKIREILGIDVKQFKQISMIAQGEFLKVLFADSDSRTEIFRKIFDTYVYDSITKRLGVKQKEANISLSKYKTQFLTNTNNIQWSNEPDFINILNDKNIHNYVKDIIELLEIELHSNKNTVNEINTEVEKLTEKVNEANVKLQKSKEVNDKFIKLDIELAKETELRKNKQFYENKQKQIENMQKILALVLPKEEMYKKIYKEIETIEEDIKQNHIELETLNKDEIEYKQKDIKVNELKLKVDSLTQQKEYIIKLDEEMKDINDILNSIKTFESLNISLQLLQQKETRIMTLKEILKDYKILNENFEKIKNEKNKSEEITQISLERENFSNEFDTANAIYREIEDKLKKEEDKFYRGQAGILAETLEEGKPCPVCGSISHPKRAKKNEVISKEELDKLKLEKEVKEKNKNESNKKLTAINAKFETLIKELNINLSKCTLNEYLDKLNEEYKVQENKIKNCLVEANKIYMNITEEKLDINEFNYDDFRETFNSRKKILEDNQIVLKTSIDNFTKKMKKELSDKTDIKEYAEDIKNIYEKSNNDYKLIEKDICNLYYDIEELFIDADEFNYNKFKEKYEQNKRIHSQKITECKTKSIQFQKQYEEKKNSSNILKLEYEQAYRSLGFETEEEYKLNILNSNVLSSLQKKINEYNNCCVENLTKIKELKGELKGKKKTDITDDTDKLEEMSLNLKRLKDTQINYSNIFLTNESIYKKLLNDSKEMLKQSELFVTIEELYKTASGTLSGKKKIEFEQYVQATYFDMILVEANKRLINMTSNRFELIRKKDSSKLSEKIGLDLEVKDNYTGKNRDVKSLSGGEAFKAALSLSLGVSDVIQSYSGGVVVDTLFIDEGFGSLDTESREQAINTLNMLTDNNKLIGIISHVTELKERIDKKIIVEKTTNGSMIKLAL